MDLKSVLKFGVAVFAGWKLHEHKDEVAGLLRSGYAKISGKVKDITNPIKTTVDTNK